MFGVYIKESMSDIKALIKNSFIVAGENTGIGAFTCGIMIHNGKVDIRDNDMISGGLSAGISCGIEIRNVSGGSLRCTSVFIDNNRAITNDPGSVSSRGIWEYDALSDPESVSGNNIHTCSTALFYDFDSNPKEKVNVCGGDFCDGSSVPVDNAPFVSPVGNFSNP